MAAKNKYDLIKTPLVTEKTTTFGEQGKYAFKVAPDANKFSVKKAIEEIFEIKVKSVNIFRQKGKVKRFKGTVGRRPNMKKAIVTLEKNHSIDLATGRAGEGIK